MQRLEVSGAVRPIHGSLGVKGLKKSILSRTRQMALSGEFALEGAMDLSEDTVGEDVQHGSVPSGTILNNEPLLKPEILYTQLTLLCSVFTSGLTLQTLLNIISTFSLYDRLSSLARNSDLCLYFGSHKKCPNLRRAQTTMKMSS